MIVRARRPGRSWAAVVCAAAAALAPSPRRCEAQEAAPEVISLSWAAPEGCPDRAAVRARIERLLGGPPRGDRRLSASASVEALPRGFRLEVSLSSGDAASTRVLQGALCDSVADAAALVIALAFDPDAVAAAESRQAEAAATAGAAPDAGAQAAAPADAQAPPPPPAPVVTADPSASPPAPPPFPARPAAPGPAVAPPSPRLSLGVLAELSGDAGSLPGVAPGVRAGLSLGYGAFRLEPAFEVWPGSRTALAERPSAGAEISLLAFTLGLCRRVLPWADPVERRAPSALGCVGFEIGEMRGAGFGVGQPLSAGALWTAPRAEVRVELPLLGPLSVALDVGLAVPLDARRFVLELADGAAVVHRPSPVAGRAGAGLSARF